MGAFKYSFQKIVDLKTSEKTQAEWVLSSALSVLSAEEQSLEELHNTRLEWEKRQLEASQSGVPLGELQMIQQYLDHLLSLIEEKAEDVRKAQIKVDQCRNKLADRMKDEKVWLKAKDHALERFRYTNQLKEQNELDEMATVRFMMPAP